MHGNMVFSRDSIFPTPQQSGCLLCVISLLARVFILLIDTATQEVHMKNI